MVITKILMWILQVFFTVKLSWKIRYKKPGLLYRLPRPESELSLKSVSVRNQVDFGTIQSVASVSTVMIICNWNFIGWSAQLGLDIVEPNHNKEEQRNKYNNTSPAILSMFRFDHQGSFGANVFKFNADYCQIDTFTSFVCWTFKLERN